MQPNTPYTPNTAQPQKDPNSIYNPLRAMREGEHVLFEIKRHPIGLAGVYATFGLLVIIAAIGAIAGPSLFPDFDRRLVSNVGLGFFLFAVVFAALFTYIARKVYYGNRWILTSDSITQVTQNSLFSKQSSQLGLDNLEDVSVEQSGILPHIFKYGVLRGQTAGEHGKFMFTYCPKPNEYAQQILMAREAFEHGEQHQNGPRPDGGNN